MKILLIDPPGRNKGLNTGLGYLSAMLKDIYDLYILDLNNIKIGNCGDPNKQINDNEMIRRIEGVIKKFRPEVVGISVKTFTAGIAKKIKDVVKAADHGIISVVGGPHITLDGNKYIQEGDFDFGIHGEGERRFLSLCHAIESKSAFSDIDGLYYWDKDILIFNKPEGTIKELDNLPFPDYGHFSSVIENNNIIPEYPLLSSRGCPYNCGYCSMPVIMGRKWRSHSSNRVIEELVRAKKVYHSKTFTVVDDNFTLNLERVEDICDKLIAKRTGLPWNSQNGIRADRISEKLAKKMKMSGCQFVWIGVESADEKVFDNISKGEKLEDVKEGIKHLKKAGIQVGGFFIVGLPLSTRESDLKSIAFAKNQGIEGWWFNFVPYPHTVATEWVEKFGRKLRSSDGALQFGTTSIEPVFDTEEYSKIDRIRTYNEIQIRMKYFDRLVDPSLRLWDKWLKIYAIVKPYGYKYMLDLMIFIVQANLKLALGSMRKLFPLPLNRISKC